MDMQNLINRYMKDMIKNKEFPYLKYWDVNILYSWTKWQKLPENSFELIEDTFYFSNGFIRKLWWGEEWMIFLEVDVQYSKNLHDFHTIYCFAAS